MPDANDHPDPDTPQPAPVLDYFNPRESWRIPPARPNPMAWWSLGCGLLALVICGLHLGMHSHPPHLWVFNENYLSLPLGVLFTLSAIVLGILGCMRIEHPRSKGDLRALTGILMALLSLYLLAFGIAKGLLIWDRYATGQFPCTACAVNLRQIGQALRMYADDNRGRYPTGLNQCLPYLKTTKYDSFLCPYGRDAMDAAGIPRPTDPQDPAFWNYIYIGTGLKAGPAAVATTVLAYEKPSNHPGQGMCVLYADGHTEWLGARDAAKFIAALPPPRPATLPAAPPPQAPKDAVIK